MKDSQTWLMLISSVAGDNKAARMRIWRALKASGAGILRDGVCLLPNSPAARCVFAEQVEEVVAAGGAAHILAFDTEGDVQQREFMRLFDRDKEYAELFARADALKERMAKLDEPEARREVASLRRDIAALASIDFFPTASARPQVERVMADVEAAVNARFSPDEPHATLGSIPKRDRAQYRNRTWATRQHLWIDRVTSAWLIRRFIDPKAKFLWLKKPRDCPKTAASFDFDGAEFTHIGARVTFEVLAASFGLDADRAITRLGALVHYLDIGGIPVPEAAGFAAIMAGVRAELADDDKLLKSMSPVLNALYASYTRPAAESE